MKKIKDENEKGSGMQSETAFQADCEKCFGLCCVALYFSASDGFPVDKAGGESCPNLQDDYRCAIHENLTVRGLKGCRGYDCFGAGPKISMETYRGISWRQADSAEEMFDCYLIMRQLQELLLYLTQAMGEKTAFSIYDSLSDLFEETRALTEMNPEALLRLDMEIYRRKVNSFLLKTSEFTRDVLQSKTGKRIKNRKNEPGPGKDLIGADLRTVELAGANLRGAYLIGADMRGCNLKGADLIGADMRDADIRGADLSESIFLNQGQLNVAIGDAGTKLPRFLVTPDHWTF